MCDKQDGDGLTFIENSELIESDPELVHIGNAAPLQLPQSLQSRLRNVVISMERTHNVYDAVHQLKSKTKTWGSKKKEVYLETTRTQVPEKELPETLRGAGQRFIGYWHV